MKKNRKGCYSEKVAICYLMEKGLDVFDSCQTNGVVDLITFDPDTGETKCWEVKTENFRLSGNKKFKSIIHLLYVHDGKCREGKKR